jgi:hypothetical protein
MGERGNVSDRRCRVVPEVVLVRRGVFGVLGIRKGEGWGEGGSRGVSLQATWERGRRILSQQGRFQISGRGPKGKQRGTKGKAKGSSKGR